MTTGTYGKPINPEPEETPVYEVERPFTIAELACIYERKLAAVADAKDKVKEAEAQRDAAEHDLYAAMDAEGMDSVKVDGYNYSLSQKSNYSVAAADMADFFEVLRNEGHGDLIKETVAAQTLGAFMREQVAENFGQMPAWADGLVKEYTRPTIGRRKG